ncbi:MAG: RnfH family protein [Steroidobacteraceae bacterium]
MGEGATKVEVVYALPDRQRVVTLALPATGLTAQAAVEHSGLLDEFPELRNRPLVLGIYGTVCAPDCPLRDRDRVEIYRPLRVDPRAQRRERAATAARKGRKR